MVEEGHSLGPAFQPLHDFDVQLSAVIARLDRCVDAAWGLSQTALPESERPFLGQASQITSEKVPSLGLAAGMCPEPARVSTTEPRGQRVHRSHAGSRARSGT